MDGDLERELQSRTFEKCESVQAICLALVWLQIFIIKRSDKEYRRKSELVKEVWPPIIKLAEEEM